MTNVALILAHNEEKTIEHVIDGLIKSKNQGLINKIVLVNDGSTDKTQDIARSKDIEIINLKKNVGKGGAFIEGVKFCAKIKANNVLTFDADLLKVTPKQVKRLLAPLKNPKTKMVLGTIKKDGTSMTGERAIKMDVLKPLYLAQNKNWIKHIQGFGLEATLNHYLGYKTIVLPRIFDRFVGRIYNGWTPFRKSVVYARTGFRALPIDRNGRDATKKAWEKRIELINRELKARKVKEIRKYRTKRK